MRHFEKLIFLLLIGFGAIAQEPAYNGDGPVGNSLISNPADKKGDAKDKLKKPKTKRSAQKDRKKPSGQQTKSESN